MSIPMKPTSAVPVFFPVSVRKFLVMSICTFGLYQIYWFYWNWRLLKHREQRRLSAPWRSVLGLIFALPLFRRMAHPAGRHSIALAFACFLTWVVLSLTSYSSEPWAVVALLSVVPLLPMQVLANRTNAEQAPLHAPNSRIRGWNLLAVAIGGLLVLLTALDLAVGAGQE